VNNFHVIDPGNPIALWIYSILERLIAGIELRSSRRVILHIIVDDNDVLGRFQVGQSPSERAGTGKYYDRKQDKLYALPEKG
jgi:hypothetical protein